MNSVVDVNDSGFEKLLFTVKSACETYIILSDQSLESKGLRSSIPSFSVSCQEVISRIPLDMTEKEISDNLVILSNTNKI